MIRCLRGLGFEGPCTGGRHQYMVRATLKLAIPNPHQDDLGADLLARILRQAGVERDEWESL